MVESKKERNEGERKRERKRKKEKRRERERRKKEKKRDRRETTRESAGFSVELADQAFVVRFLPKILTRLLRVPIISVPFSRRIFFVFFVQMSIPTVT